MVLESVADCYKAQKSVKKAVNNYAQSLKFVPEC